MNTSHLQKNRLPALLRTAALGLALALPCALGHAQTAQGPLVTPNPPSPTTPIPFSWNTFHSGGAPLLIPSPLIPTPPGYLPPNPLAAQGQGTPTGTVLPTGTAPGGVTEIPSFLIGNYDFTRPPGSGGINGIDANGNIAYFPNNFGDAPQNAVTWSAPFTFLASTGQTTSTTATQGHTTIVADDSQTAAFVYATTPTPTGIDAGWTVQWTTSVTGTGTNTWGNPIANQTAAGPPVDATNPNGTPMNYRRQTAIATAIGSPYPAGRRTATWTFTAPTSFAAPAAAGLYSVAFRLPDPQTATNPVDGTTNTNFPEKRIADAHYVIQLNGTTVFDTDTLDNNPVPALRKLLSRAGINQTETNNPQPLAGPFALKAGDTLTVELDNTTTQTLAANAYVLADSVQLVPTASAGGSARMDGSPVAINVTDFPEIANALYYGFATTTTAGIVSQSPDNANPFGNAVIGTTAIGTGTTLNSAQQHNIRQLVYFGRYEGIVLTSPTGGLVDINNQPTTTPATRMVGAIYCVNGITGDVVWRFQTPDVLNPDSTSTRVSIAKPSAAVYATPSIARLNVLVNVNGVLTLETKLCVVVADDNGLVYCLDAIGNRNGTANNNAVDPVYNQPIYNPNAPLVTGSAQDVATDANGNPIGHVGNTTAYWVYRPDAARPRVLPVAPATIVPPAVKAIDPTSDLPVPAAFGLASPTVYVDPNVPTQQGTLLPNGTPTGTDPPTVASNGIVYIGNSNGTLYSLNAGGTAVQPVGTPPVGTAGVLYSPSETYNYVLPISQTGYQITTAPATQPDNSLPTPAVKWWFAVNKGATNNDAQTANVAITSAPSIYQPTFNPTLGTDPTPLHYIYFGTSNETTNVGNVFAVSNFGPTNPSLAVTAPFAPGSTNYNTLERPFWSFPNAYTNTGPVGNKMVHAALGSIGGSPVVFTNPNDGALLGLGTPAPTRIYFDANQGPEGYQAERPVPAENGRIWSVDAISGQAVWAYPDTVDPNKDNASATQTTTLGGQSFSQTQIDNALGTFRNASPAVGIVQFPATITYGTAGATAYLHADRLNTTTISGARVPMLYVGGRTGAPDSSNFFALDLDGTNDNERNIFYDTFTNRYQAAAVGQTFGPGFEASPLLVTNPGPTATGTLTGGNGGVVFAVERDGTLNELSATPLTDIGTDSTGPQVTNFFAVGGFGTLSSPAIAGFIVTDLATSNTAGIAGLAFDSDWVYGGDGNLGIARGITPGTFNNGSASGTIDFGTAGTGPDALRPPNVPQQFPLHVYLFDGKGTHDPKSTDMGKANKTSEPLAAFEWGDKLYIRISNVVPPNPTNDPTLHMFDASGNDKTVYYTNGGAVTVQLSDIDAQGKIVAGRGADIATINTNTLASLADPTSNGFVKEGGAGLDDVNGEMLTDNNGTGTMWLGATTYAIGNGSNRKNTPGSRRQIISATQTAEAHVAVADGTHQVGDFLQNVTLRVSVDSSPNSYRVRNTAPPPYSAANPPFFIKRLPKVDQPTFAVLNPLAVRGGGPNIPLGGTSQVAQINNIVGPFEGINTTNLSSEDLAAYSNGNRTYVATGAGGAAQATDLPSGSVLSGDKPKRFRPVTTVTTDIPHGSVGSNGNPNPTANGFTQQTSTAARMLDTTLFGNYAFDVADRSVLGLNGDQISNLTVQTATAEWNDNTDARNGPGAVVNPLPWDDAPTAYRAGNNGSVDYPNIGKQRINHLLNTVNNGKPSVSDNPGTLDIANGIATNPTARTVQPDNIEIEVSVPKYQPANLQLYELTIAPTGTTPGTFQRIPPAGLNSSAQFVYPMGYVARETVYVDSNHNHRRDDGEAFRTFRVYTGVPVDMSVSVDNPTLDLGKLPQTFGVQTDASTVLGAFMPFYQPAGGLTPLQAAQKLPGYQRYFQPLSVHNNGNINLLNIHFDQKLRRYTGAAVGTPPDSALPFGSDAIGALAVLKAYDFDGVAGPARDPITGAVTTEQQYILRTSLDSDLAPFNRNPGLVANNNAAYPNATFHKARVSDALPTTLTVPDVPHDNPLGSPYYVSATLPSTYNPSGLPLSSSPPILDATTHQPLYTAPPYIGLAVPLGTPVGAYAQDVRLFEGIDPAGYPNIQTNGSTLYKPLFPPLYGKTTADGTTAPANGTDDTLTTLGSAVTQPYSNPTRVRAVVTETRVTDGATYGNLPQFDPYIAPGTIPPTTADFLPVAFRGTFWNGGTETGNNSLSLYWTSSRVTTPTMPYGLVGAHAPFTTSGGKGYFAANTTAGRWFDQITTLAAPAASSVNTAISIAPDQHLMSNGTFHSDGTAYAFVENVAQATSATANRAAQYSYNLYCYAVDPATGAVGGTPVPVPSSIGQTKFGARGLKYDNALAGFTDALAPGNAITDNLWVFWNSGARAHSTLFYSSAPAAGINNYAGGNTPFTTVLQALPTPAGLSNVADPSAIVALLPVSGGGTVPVVDVTYSGVTNSGNTDVYVSHYRPYIVRKPGSTDANPIYLTDANNKQVYGLALTPGPAITEQLLPDTAGQFYQARDVAWARADTIDVQVNSQHILQDMSKTANADGSHPLYAGIRTSYDTATGTAVYSNISHDTQTMRNVFAVSNKGDYITVTTVYADLARGRVRLRTAYYASTAATTPIRFDVALPLGSLVSATFQPQARRITTDRRADTQPVAFIDDTYKTNEVPGLKQRVQTSRYWFVWRKSAAPGTTTTPTLYTKTQRLTLYLHNGSNQPVGLPLDPTTGLPTLLTLTDNTTNTTISNSSVDVDWTRGRIYFPQSLGVEGHSITAHFTFIDSSGTSTTGTAANPDVTGNVQWLDEIRANDITNQPSGRDADAVDTTEHAVPIDVAVNEGSPSAFLDPLAYADVFQGAYDPFGGTGFFNAITNAPNPDQPHKVWLFWNSTRSGTADVFYETIDPRFSANP